MKLIVAIIQPTRLETVQRALHGVGVTRMTVCDAQGFARQRGQVETYRGAEYQTNLLRKVALEIAVSEDFVEPTIQCLIDVGKTVPGGAFGDGKIFVMPMTDVIQMSDEQSGPGAV